jgi:hypothetical protein
MRYFAIIFILYLSNLGTFGQANDLPLIAEKFDTSKYLIFDITGDRGMGGFDVKLANEYKAHHLSYIYLDAF